MSLNRTLTFKDKLLQAIDAVIAAHPSKEESKPRKEYLGKIKDMVNDCKDDDTAIKGFYFNYLMQFRQSSMDPKAGIGKLVTYTTKNCDYLGEVEEMLRTQFKDFTLSGTELHKSIFTGQKQKLIEKEYHRIFASVQKHKGMIEIMVDKIFNETLDLLAKHESVNPQKLAEKQNKFIFSMRAIEYMGGVAMEMFNQKIQAVGFSSGFLFAKEKGEKTIGMSKERALNIYRNIAHDEKEVKKVPQYYAREESRIEAEKQAEKTRLLEEKAAEEQRKIDKLKKEIELVKKEEKKQQDKMAREAKELAEAAEKERLYKEKVKEEVLKEMQESKQGISGTSYSVRYADDDDDAQSSVPSDVVPMQSTRQRKSTKELEKERALIMIEKNMEIVGRHLESFNEKYENAKGSYDVAERNLKSISGEFDQANEEYDELNRQLEEFTKQINAKKAKLDTKLHSLKSRQDLAAEKAEEAKHISDKVYKKVVEAEATLEDLEAKRMGVVEGRKITKDLLMPVEINEDYSSDDEYEYNAEDQPDEVISPHDEIESKYSQEHKTPMDADDQPPIESTTKSELRANVRRAEEHVKVIEKHRDRERDRVREKEAAAREKDAEIERLKALLAAKESNSTEEAAPSSNKPFTYKPLPRYSPNTNVETGTAEFEDEDQNFESDNEAEDNINSNRFRGFSSTSSTSAGIANKLKGQGIKVFPPKPKQPQEETKEQQEQPKAKGSARPLPPSSSASNTLNRSRRFNFTSEVNNNQKNKEPKSPKAKRQFSPPRKPGKGGGGSGGEDFT